MAERRWGAIASGATFEALATTLVRFEDPNAALFGRRGADGGQDARSGDGTRVFQMKHHEDGSSAKAIADAKAEAKKVREYRAEGHPRCEQWRGVTHWRLVTNATFNPADRQRWIAEVVPLFTEQGLTPEYWEQADLEALLDKHPEVHRSFFDNETRALLSMPEVRDRLPAEEPFLRRAPGKFVGREKELAAVREFLTDDKLFLVVAGSGGIGKTRLLIEAGEAIASEGAWQVLWANVASMASTGAWFEAIVPERPTLLLVDEPPDEQLLQQLSEQLGGRVGRAAAWKVAVAVRSPKDPVLRFLRGPRMKPRVRESLTLAPLPPEDAGEMCFDLISSGPLLALPETQRREAAQELARRFDRHPIWMTLAVHVLESRGTLADVPSTALDLADVYVEEIIRSQREAPPDQILALLRWVALLRTVNRFDDTTIGLISEGSSVGTSDEVRAALARLITRQALVERGVNKRLIELKPDVLRDHVLLRWLSLDLGTLVVPSPDGKALVARVRDALLSASGSALELSILASLGRTEFILELEGKPVPLLLPFFDGATAAVDAMPASRRVALAKALVPIASFRPAHTAALIRILRSSTAATETQTGLFKDRTVTQEDIILELAWPLFHAAMGARDVKEQMEVLGELCALAEAEADVASRLPRGLPNDGKRAAALIARTIEGGPQFWGEFDEAAETHALTRLDEIARGVPTVGKAAAVNAVVQPALAMERQQTWSDEHSFFARTRRIEPGQRAWSTREKLRTRLKDLLAADITPRESRLLLWSLFVKAHGPKREQRLDDLVWARSVLLHRKDDLRELAAARELWSWYVRFEKDDKELRAACDELESLYTGNALAAEFQPLTPSYENLAQGEVRAAAKAAGLADSDSPRDIEAFVDRAVQFVGGESGLPYFFNIASALGRLARTHAVVRTFVEGTVSQPSVSQRTHFGIVAAASWVATVRQDESPSAAHALVVELLRQCANDAQRIAFVGWTYGGLPRPKRIGVISAEEQDQLRKLAPMFLRNAAGPAFIAAIAPTFDYDWPGLKALLEDVLTVTKGEDLAKASAALVEAVYVALQPPNPQIAPDGLASWLLDQVIRIPDLDDLDAVVEWQLEDMLKRLGRPGVTWLSKALAARARMERESKDRHVGGVGHQKRPSKYVEPITPADGASASVLEAVSALVGLGEDRGSVGYYLGDMLGDVDPSGILVPSALTALVKGVDTPQDLVHLARLARAYAVGSPPWRMIARPLLEASVSFPDEKRRALYSAITDGGMRTWSGLAGQVPEIFRAAVTQARLALESESDEQFRGLWLWRLDAAEAELRQQEEESQEEPGE